VMVVYFGEWTIYNLLKDHIQWLWMMLEIYWHIHFPLNNQKCIFSTPIGILLRHIICKDGIKVDMEKIKVILDLKPLVNKKKSKSSLGILGIVESSFLTTLILNL
jgi:hypothetical protein